MTRRKFKSSKFSNRHASLSFEQDDFSYWDPYYVDSDIVQRFKRSPDDEVPEDIEDPGDAAAPEEGGSTTESTPPGTFEQHLTPAIGLTATFAVLFIILPFFVRKGPKRGITQCSIMIALFCMWLFWVTIYIAQMNPLMGPRLENTTLAWIAHKLGNKVDRSNATSAE